MNQYQSSIQLGKVVLNVYQLSNMRNFYVEVLGMQVLFESETSVHLTVDGKNELIVLQKVHRFNEANYGLYHLALLVANQEVLGRVLRHFIKHQVPLEGGADHGYSEAIYLRDPENNGIEIYADRPTSMWDIREDGRIIGVTEELDVDYLMRYSEQEKFQLPADTIMGHIHLSVKNAKSSSKEYQTIFDMSDKMTIPTASWIASGNYHHHLAFNQWVGSHLAKRSIYTTGLAYFTVIYHREIEWKNTIQRAQESKWSVQQLDEKTFELKDTDGICSLIKFEPRDYA